MNPSQTPYSPLTVANSFIELANKEGRGLTQLQMQKLSYLFYGWGWALFDRPLVDHHVEAWKFGPVFPPLYYETRFIGSQELDRYIPTGLNPWLYEGKMEELIPRRDSESRKLVDFIWRRYGHMTGPSLIAITHKEGSPWYKTWHNDEAIQQGRRNLVIKDELIQEEYKKLRDDLYRQLGDSSAN